VQLLAAGFEQGAVGGVLDQRVLEAVGRLGWDPAAVDEFGSDQLIESGEEFRLLAVSDRGEQRVGELAAQCSADLRDLCRDTGVSQTADRYSAPSWLSPRFLESV
jgi:hypothetical protein